MYNYLTPQISDTKQEYILIEYPHSMADAAGVYLSGRWVN